MPVNEFLPFAAAAGANVMTQAAYAALPALSTGFQAGTAQSAQVNKAVRQSSAIAAAVGALIAQDGGVDARDDGNAAALLAGLKAALIAISQSTGIQVFSSVPAAEAGETIYVPPYGIMNWISAGSYYRSEQCGVISYGATASARPGTHELNGDTVSKVGLYAGLWAWAQESGLVVALGSWTPSTLSFASVDSGNFRLPDVRADYFRNWDHGRGIDVGRALGSSQLDAIQNLTGEFGAQVGASLFANGIFAKDGPPLDSITASVSGTQSSVTFDASRVARTANETRVRSVAAMPVIHI